MIPLDLIGLPIEAIDKILNDARIRLEEIEATRLQRQKDKFDAAVEELTKLGVPYVHAKSALCAIWWNRIPHFKAEL
jgi:hypothetical protein